MFYSYPGIKVNTPLRGSHRLVITPNVDRRSNVMPGVGVAIRILPGHFLILKLSAQRRRVCRHVAPSGVGHDEHFGDGGLVDVRELEQPQFARAE